MRPRSRIVLLAVTAAIVLAFALAVILEEPAGRSTAGTSTAGGSTTEGTRSSSGFDGVPLPTGVRSRDFTLTDQHSRRVSLGKYRGRVTILTFLSSACRPTCPLVAQQIRGALDDLGRGVPTLAVSANPAADIPANVRRFLGEAALTRRVEYLTGSRTQLQPIWRAYGVVPTLLGDASSPHSASVLLIDRRGFERVVFPVEQLTPEGLAHDIRKLEAG